MVKIGIAGAGFWGKNLIRNTASASNAQLAAVCDLSSPSLDRVGQDYPSIEVYHDFDAMVQSGRLDAVAIATPPAHHFAHACAAMEAGLDVLIEKPMCKSSPQARVLIELAKRHKRILMVGHTFLYSNLVHEVKRRIVSGELGHVYCINSQRLNLGRLRDDVDCLWNFAPHDISIAAFLLDDWPRSVNARGANFLRPNSDLADVAYFQMDFADGRMMTGHVSWLDPQKVRRMVIVGSQKMLVYDDVDSQRHIQVYDKSVERDFQSSTEGFSDFVTRTRAGDLVVPNVRLIEPLRVEMEHFASCVQQRDCPRTDGEHGYRVLCVLEALSRSMARQGRPVKVDYGCHDRALAGKATAPDRWVAQTPKSLERASLLDTTRPIEHEGTQEETSTTVQE